MKKTRYYLWILVTAFVFFNLAFAAKILFWSSQNPSLASRMIADVKFGTPFNLLDQNGQAITEKAFEGRPSLMFFGFTSCPDICPTTLYDMALWLEDLGEDAKGLGAFFITVDPERDSPELVKDYVEAHSDQIIGITGDLKGIEDLARAWRVYHRKINLEDGDYTMDHTASVLLVRADGSLQGTITYGERPEVAMEKIRLLLKS